MTQQDIYPKIYFTHEEAIKDVFSDTRNKYRNSAMNKCRKRLRKTNDLDDNTLADCLQETMAMMKKVCNLIAVSTCKQKMNQDVALQLDKIVDDSFCNLEQIFTEYNEIYSEDRA